MTGRKDEMVTTKDDQNLSREMVRDDRDERDDRPFNISVAKVTIRNSDSREEWRCHCLTPFSTDNAIRLLSHSRYPPISTQPQFPRFIYTLTL
jgi:hypothetical protein